MLKVISDEQKPKVDVNTELKEPKLDITMEDIDPHHAFTNPAQEQNEYYEELKNTLIAEQKSHETRLI